MLKLVVVLFGEGLGMLKLVVLFEGDGLGMLKLLVWLDGDGLGMLKLFVLLQGGGAGLGIWLGNLNYPYIHSTRHISNQGKLERGSIFSTIVW